MWRGYGKASLIVVLLLILGTFQIAFTIFPVNAVAITHYVGGSGPGNHTSIQNAIDNANPGDTVFVFSGIYLEHLTILKTLSLKGENAETTIIDGGGTSNVIRIRSDWTNITGFTVRNSGPLINSVGIWLDSVEHCRIADNILSNNSRGVDLGHSHNNTVANNKLSGNSVGIRLGLSDHNVVDNNSLLSNGPFGIWIGNSNHNILRYNLVYWFGERGIFVQSTVGTTLLRNTVSSGRDRGYGISLVGTQETIAVGNILYSNWLGLGGSSNDNNTYSENFIFDNHSGLGCSLCHNITVTNNTSVRNLWLGLGFGYSRYVSVIGNFVGWNQQVGIVFGFTGPPSENCIVYHNTIVENAVQGFSNSSDISWNDAYPSGGNYWSDYSGVDQKNGPGQDQPGGDGIGDTAYFGIEGVFNVDRYPLMDPFVQVPTASSAPPSLVAVGGNKQVTLTWLPPASDGGSPITSYNVHRGNSSGGESFLVEVWNELTYLDRDVVPGQTYYYIVSANNAFGESPPSNEASATPFSLPGKPEVSDAILSGENWENVTLMWMLSEDDGGGDMSVVGYQVYRNMTYDVDGLGYMLIATVPNGTFEYTDHQVGEGDPNNYFYQVCAVDSSSNSTCSDRQAGKFTRSVSEGPNLVSIPLIQSNESIETVFQTVSFDKAWTYEAVWNRWISFMTFKSYRGELKTVNHRMGVWVNITEASNLTVAGIVPWTTSIMMMPGWNLVGFPSFNSDRSVGEMKSVLSVLRVEGFESSTPPYFLRVLSDSDKLETGYGYWVYSVLSVIWDVYGS